MLSNIVALASRTGYLFVVSICAFAASVFWLYNYTESYRGELVNSIRLSGWVSYQAQLEYVKLAYELDLCRNAMCNTSDVMRQAEIFYSRLDVLVNSEESEDIPYIQSHRVNVSNIMSKMYPILQDFSYGSTLSTQQIVVSVGGIRAAVEDAGHILQDLLRDAQLYNHHIERRERVSLLNPAAAFAALGTSGLALMLLLAREVRARGAALRRLQSLRLHEQRLRSDLIKLMESLPLPVVVVGDDSKVAYGNAVADEILGGDQSRNRDALFALLRGGGGNDGASVRVALHLGTSQVRTFRCLVTRTQWGSGSAAICVLQDTTYDGDAHLRSLSVGKMAVLGELSFAIAHELNQPLSTIKAAVSNAKILLSRGGDEKQIEAKIDRIDDQVDRIGNIIAKIRSLSSKDKSNSAFSLNVAISSAIDLVRHQYHIENIRIVCEQCDHDIGNVRGDQTLLELAIVNILINARDAFVASRQSAGIERIMRISVEQRGPNAILVFSDNAGGIHPHVLPRIFDFFVSTKGQTGGMGIGLAIAKRCIDDMGGSIGAANSTEGAVFTVELPIYRAEETL